MTSKPCTFEVQFGIWFESHSIHFRIFPAGVNYSTTLYRRMFSHDKGAEASDGMLVDCPGSSSKHLRCPVVLILAVSER